MFLWRLTVVLMHFRKCWWWRWQRHYCILVWKLCGELAKHLLILIILSISVEHVLQNNLATSISNSKETMRLTKKWQRLHCVINKATLVLALIRSFLDWAGGHVSWQMAQEGFATAFNSWVGSSRRTRDLEDDSSWFRFLCESISRCRILMVRACIWQAELTRTMFPEGVAEDITSQSKRIRTISDRACTNDRRYQTTCMAWLKNIYFCFLLLRFQLEPLFWLDSPLFM